MRSATPGPGPCSDPPEGWDDPAVVLREFQLFVKATYGGFGWDPRTHWVFKVHEDMTPAEETWPGERGWA